MWLDRSRKIITCSFLCSWFMGSFGLGLVICLKMDLPVFPVAHSFIHSSFLFVLIICCAVLYDVGRFGCIHVVPCLASVSALSLPGMLACPGIHCIMSLTVWMVAKWLIVLYRLLIVELLSFSLSNACSTDLLSVKMTVFWTLSGYILKILSK